jgi:hypothetical protein
MLDNSQNNNNNNNNNAIQLIPLLVFANSKQSVAGKH